MRVRVAFDRDLLFRPFDVPPRGVRDRVTGLRVAGLGIFVRFDRVFEVDGLDREPPGATLLNVGLRVSFDQGHGLRFWPDEDLDCGWEVCDWLVYEPVAWPYTVAPRSVDRGVFEGLLDRYGDLLVEDEHLSTTSFRLEPVSSASPVVLAGGRSA
ncbi:hypothetical protein [Actinomyces succiniciruminis]|uniref:Uncharacterized protein n=1 Tax=Actinomyces succiniciruminis TaxID=1522002 RepID=A0A1L7RMY9_9ACTO|nr:hypothetical protein [Actinomyces succiniciruminis]CED90453.1 Hypothetical protein AAM4_0558 [Actinomyces succiniciruminis]